MILAMCITHVLLALQATMRGLVFLIAHIARRDDDAAVALAAADAEAILLVASIDTIKKFFGKLFTSPRVGTLVTCWQASGQAILPRAFNWARHTAQNVWPQARLSGSRSASSNGSSHRLQSRKAEAAGAAEAASILMRFAALAVGYFEQGFFDCRF